jgi:hypothetical protein
MVFKDIISSSDNLYVEALIISSARDIINFTSWSIDKIASSDNPFFTVLFTISEVFE